MRRIARWPVLGHLAARLIRPVRGFKTLKTAYATIKGFEVMRAQRKGQGAIFRYLPGVAGEVSLVNRTFGLC